MIWYSNPNVVVTPPIAVLSHLTGYSAAAADSAEGIWGDGKVGLSIPITGFQMVSGPGNARNFRALVTTNLLTVATTVTFNIGAIPTALSVVYAPGETGLKGPIAGPVPVADGALLSFKSDSPGATTGSITVLMSLDFGP